MQIHDGILEGARQIASPNCDDRPDDEISLLVVHNISLPPGQFGGGWIDDLFTNRLDPGKHDYFREIHQMRVSSHVLIRRDGEIVQYVPFDKRAWHAGESSFEGRAACNDFSIGVELEGTDSVPYTEEQYRQLAGLIADLQNHYPHITHDRITGHRDIAPERKTDPGEAFDWGKMWTLLDHEISLRDNSQNLI